VDRTAVRGRVGLTQGATRIPAAAPPQRGAIRFRTLLFRYLAVGFILLATVVVAKPQAPQAASPEAWDYQREQVEVEGRGILNAYARGAVKATAWLAKASIERQRDMFRLSLFDLLVGAGAAEAVGRWRAANAPSLEGATKVAMVALVGYGLVRRPAWRTLAAAVLVLLVATVVLTRPQATVERAAAAGVAVPNAMLAIVTRVAPLGSGDPEAAEATQRRLLTRYWASFVAHPLSRMQTGTPVLVSAPPEKKAGVLKALRRNVSAVNDWAIGHRGPERAFIATSALGYVLPFAVGLGVLAMVAACAQTMLFLLCLGGLFALPLAVLGPRHRGGLIRYWLAPLLGCVAVLAAAALASFGVVRAAETLHASDEYVGLLLAGSTWPVLVAVVAGRWLVRRREGPAVAAPPAGPTRVPRGADR
jgi:hypothetical protein